MIITIAILSQHTPDYSVITEIGCSLFLVRQVLRWHWAMLMDEGRNAPYDLAITKVPLTLKPESENAHTLFSLWILGLLHSNTVMKHN